MTPRAAVKVEVQIAPTFADHVSAEYLQEVAEAALRHEGQVGELALVVTDDEGIQALNRDFLGQDTPTDVLSFSAQEDAGPFVVAPGAGSYLGDVILSYPRAVAQAKEHGHSVSQEMNLLIVHGILHLLGYDHADAEAEAAMWSRQEEILRAL